MYIWIGIKVEGQLDGVKAVAVAEEKRLGLDCSCYTLPMHISLKMSFPVDEDRVGDVTDEICKALSMAEPFEVKVRGIEKDGGIVWIMMQDSPLLRLLHDRLCNMLVEKFGVTLHEYDLDYKFHTTLFMDSDTDKLAIAYGAVKDIAIPDTIKVDSFLIGSSESGALGTYRVYKEINISGK